MPLNFDSIKEVLEYHRKARLVAYLLYNGRVYYVPTSLSRHADIYKGDVTSLKSEGDAEAAQVFVSEEATQRSHVLYSISTRRQVSMKSASVITLWAATYQKRVERHVELRRANASVRDLKVASISRPAQLRIRR